MGALHGGHASLIRAARGEPGFVVVSLFVNPLQFGPQEDFQRYPRPTEQDLALCAAEGVDLVFAPAPAEVYLPGFCTQVEVAGLQDLLEGASRPGHFRGVATVVLKLFNIVQPDRAYFGQKDAQQVRIIEQMVRDLNVPVELRIGTIVREPDGLALSSRNRYLDPEERRHAVVLSRALDHARDLVTGGERHPRVIEAALRALIQATPGAGLDYAVIVDAETLAAVDRLEGRLLVLLAVRFGSVRLIDNLVLLVQGNPDKKQSAAT
jgi:pantoate--beta-alanine ligase